MRRGRYAPTPSGFMHLGNACTALLAWLHMRNLGGAFVLRVEDIDKQRSRREYAEAILADLRWLGLDWDEGPDIGGPYGPYVQSEREDRYAAAMETLERLGVLYPCFCSRADLRSAVRAPHGLASEGPVYSGKCRHLTAAEREVLSGRKQPAYRFRLPDKEVTFTDGLAGFQRVPPGFGGDFVVKRADGMYAYQLAVVVDDAEMEMTDVVRGWDLLDSTPRQLLLFEALGRSAPQYIHVPLVLGPDGTRLAKRHGADSITDMRRKGLKPEKVIGVLAFLCGLLDKPEPVRPSELVDEFSLAKLTVEPMLLTDRLLEALSP